MKHLEAGDILIVSAKPFKLFKPLTWVSQAIGWFMKIYLKKTDTTRLFKAYLNRWGVDMHFIPTHSAMVYNSWGMPYVSEALKEGATCHPFVKAYSPEDYDRIVVLRPKEEYSDEEIRALGRRCQAYSLIPHKYDDISLLLHIIKIYTGSWIGKKGAPAKKRIYCVELTADEANDIRLHTFPEPSGLNPVEMMMNEKYRPIPFSLFEESVIDINE